MASGSASDQPLPIRIARIEDTFHRWRARRARRRGLVTTVIPYSGYGGDGWVRVLCRVVLTRGPQQARQRADKVRGWRSFFSIPVTDEVILTIGGGEHRLQPERGGVVDARIDVRLPPGRHTISMRTADTDAVTASVFVVDPAARLGILSDIDDTVMVTALPRPLLAAWNTFVLDEHARTPVAGMAVLYDRLAHEHPDAPIVYLSTGAWNVAPTLNRFLSRNLYPAGAMLLTDWGPTQDRWFRSGQEHKRTSLERLAQEFPHLRWLLLGDDGQHDEALYGDFAARHPGKVAAIAIRRLSPGEAVLAGGRSRLGDDAQVSVPWVSAPDGAGLAEALRGVGLLDEADRP